MRWAVVLLSIACGPGVGTGDGEASTDTTGASSTASSATTTSTSSVDDGTGPSESSTGADETTAAPPSCDGMCIDEPGPPWRGPLAIGTSEDPSSVVCPAGYGQAIATFGHTLINTDAPCQCNCASPNGSDCTATLHEFPEAGCIGEAAMGTVGPFCGEVAAASVMMEPPTHAEICEPWSQPPNSDWDLHTVLCEGELSATCEGEQGCAPTPGLEGVVCYWAPGVEPCPPGFPDSLVVFSAVDDQRTCAQGCACDGDRVCEGEASVRDQCDMDLPVIDMLLPGECLDLPGGIALTPDFSTQGDCTPSIPTVPVMGDIFEDAPQTLCCTSG